MNPLVSERLRLREMTGEDLDFIATMLADSEVMHHYPKTLSRDEAREWLARQRKRYADDGHGLWLVEARPGGKPGEHSSGALAARPGGKPGEQSAGVPIGQVGLVMQEIDGTREPEIGYLIHSPFWGRGYATEAALAVREAAFGMFRYDHVVSLIRPENAPSQAVARRLGMAPTHETIFRGLPHIVFRVERDPLGRPIA